MQAKCGREKKKKKRRKSNYTSLDSWESWVEIHSVKKKNMSVLSHYSVCQLEPRTALYRSPLGTT